MQPVHFERLVGLTALLVASGGCLPLDGMVTKDAVVDDAGAGAGRGTTTDAGSVGVIVRADAAAAGDPSDPADGAAGDACAEGACACSDGLCMQKLVFVTTGLYAADLGGLAGADTKCQVEALSGGRAGTYKAWLADATSGPSARMTHATVPYRLADGTLVANDWADLTSGTLRHAIDQKLDASRVSVNEGTCPKMARVWSGATPAGLAAPAFLDPVCGGWTSSSSSSSGPAADAFAVDGFWSQGCGATCDSRLSLYCVEQ